MRKFVNIKKLAQEYGAINLRFFIPMSPIHSAGFGLGIGFSCSSDPMVERECVIDERRYKASEGFKVELRAIEKDGDTEFYGSQSFYQMDLESMMDDMPDEYRVYVLVDEDNKYHRLCV